MIDAPHRTGRVLRLRDDQIQNHLAAARGFVIVEFSTGWSVSCRLMRPLIRKLAIEFAASASVVALDGDEAFTFRRTYAVDCIPQILAFENGRLVARYRGEADAYALHKWFAETLYLPRPSANVAERAFLEAFGRAKAAYDDILAPASSAVKPHLDAVGPRMDAFERSLATDREAGRITDDQEMERRSAEFARVFGPFRAELDALAAAEEAGIVAYEDLMAEALDEFLAQAMHPADISAVRAAESAAIGRCGAA